MWDILRSLILKGNISWAAIGDLNAILSPLEKSFWRSCGRRCPSFGEFMEKAELTDLGFQGPPFTSHRGGLFERLN